MSLNESPQKLYNVGLNYKKADINVRGAFSITKENQVLLLKEAKENGCEGLFVVSTCNRTEITGFAEHPFELISLLVKYSKGKVADFIHVSNVYKNKAAVNHLFNIGVGLESQILGDYEIVSQLKNSFNQAKKLGTTNAYLERLINLVLQASKEVKNMMDFISWCDGDKNLLEIADKVKIPIWELYNILELMIKHDLIELIDRD